ncbi:hypothetical protein UFOVP778_29 [uncultured Caudovirales phage]|uniref:Uncharacterized protein n=1 Tax=uncultured Caudovirales phage TaxID=2100421 RepID=A0A6J5NQS2_9CAUD|nr:hypothetical protein UFOVP778_29 [uncultured Caudovirales phage]
MKKSISSLEWFGKAKFHYIVKRDSYEVYRCTSVMKDQNDVLETLIDRFKADSGVVRIFCNGIEIKVLNKLKMGRKPKYHWSNPS